MKIGFLDLSNGIAGDMIVASFIDAGLPIDYLRDRLKDLNIGRLSIDAERVISKGISGTRFMVHAIDIEHDPLSHLHGSISKKEIKSKPSCLCCKVMSVDHKHEHSSINEIIPIVRKTDWDTKIKDDIERFFDYIAEAEGYVHGIPKDSVHFHELGAIDSIADICSIVIGIHYLGIERIYATPVNLGSGKVKTQHGLLPVPAPATALLMKDIPCFMGNSGFEQTTPTGAAFLKTYLHHGDNPPVFKPKSIGYGFGTHDIKDGGNYMRLIIADTDEEDDWGLEHEEIVVIETDIDDQNPEVFSNLSDDLKRAGAIDSMVRSVLMKKGRLGFEVTVLVREDKIYPVLETLFRSTTTLGVRIRREQRLCLKREFEVLHSRFGDIEVKLAYLGERLINAKPEYNDMIRIAHDRDMGLKQVYNIINAEIAKRYEF